MRGGARKGAGRKPLCPDGEGRMIKCSFAICAGLHGRFAAWCKAHKASKSAIIQALVAEFLDGKEEQK